jgi:hypothetical protein
MSKHRADGDAGYSVHGRDNRGVADGEQDSSRADTREQFDQALADQRARNYEARHANGER